MDQDDVLDRWRGPLYKLNPRHAYVWNHEAVRTNRVCGDQIRLKVYSPEGIVRWARWDGTACCLTCAVTDAFCGRILGLPLAEALAVDPLTLVEFDIGINRRGCVTLPAEALKEALREADPQLQAGT